MEFIDELKQFEVLKSNQIVLFRNYIQKKYPAASIQQRSKILAVPEKKQSTERANLNKQIYGLAFGMFLVFVFFYSIPTNMAIYLQENQIANATTSGLIMAFASLGGIFGGMLLVRFKHLLGYYLVPGQSLLMGAGFSLIAFTSNVITVSAGVFIMGLGAGTLIPTIYSAIFKVAEKRQMMTAMAIVQSCMYLGQFMSPIILDTAARLFGQGTNKSIYSISAYLTLTVAILMFIFVIVKSQSFRSLPAAKEGQHKGK